MKYILFDLDGTLTDPWRGLLNGYRAMENGMGREAFEEESYRRWIGPPIQQSLRDEWSLDGEDIDAAVGHFRTYYSKFGLYENDVYPGVETLLATLHEKFVLCVATSKPEVYAKQILEHFHLAKYFKHIVGCNLDGTRTNKSDVIAEVMRRLDVFTAEDYVMIGDRKMDVLGASSHGIDTIGVLWGYGDAEELQTAGAMHCVITCEELENRLTAKNMETNI
ncbi:MAG: HAD hydrolase-like protein [Bacilli bacterium]